MKPTTTNPHQSAVPHKTAAYAGVPYAARTATPQQVGRGSVPQKGRFQSATENLAEVPGAALSGPVDRVGMQGLELPLHLSLPHALTCVPAQVDIQLSLDDPQSRGLHLSRVYNILVQKLSESIFLPHSYQPNIRLIKTLLTECLSSQQALSRSVFLKIDFVLPVPRQSLLSQRAGWRQYPVQLEASLKTLGTDFHKEACSRETKRVGFENSQSKGVLNTTARPDFQFALGGEVLYSSTCPCSAALSQQAWQEALAQDFTQPQLYVEDVKNWLARRSVATPHAQRSRVRFKLQLADKHLEVLSSELKTQAAENLAVGDKHVVSQTTLGVAPQVAVSQVESSRQVVPPQVVVSRVADLSYIKIIDSIEQVLATPVQGAVSRRDEKEFARLNAQNTMFCEDAARRLRQCFIKNKNFKAFELHIQHEESLHPHNVVALVRHP